MGLCNTKQEKPQSLVREPSKKIKKKAVATPEENCQNLKIQQNLALKQQEDEGKVKLLLLGSGGSGKSTVFKQMRILHGPPRDEEDLRMHGVVIRSNIVVAVRYLCILLNELNLESKLDKESATATAADREDASGMTPTQAYTEIVSYLVNDIAEPPFPKFQTSFSNDWVGFSAGAGNVANTDSKLFLQHVEAIRVLWQCDTMKEVWSKRAMSNINDTHKEYLQDLSRIASPDYIPTHQDILMARIRTTQITTERYRIDGIVYELHDVGGQRSERRKWICCFENVDAVIFVAALSEYDQTLVEAKRTNRMVEALELFRSVCNNCAFADTSILLFLNKKDIFAEKIVYSDISLQRPFSDYAGGKDFDHGVFYFIQQFKKCLIDDDFNDSFIHVTCATDTNNMEFVLDSARTIIMTDNLRRSGFVGPD